MLVDTLKAHGILINVQKTRWLATAQLTRRLVTIDGLQVAALPPEAAMRILGVSLTAAGAAPTHMASRVGLAHHRARAARRGLRGLLGVRDQVRRLSCTVTPLASWGMELCPPSRTSMRMWTATQQRIFAPFIIACPHADETPVECTRRRHRDTRQKLDEWGHVPWGKLQAQLYFRLAARVVALPAPALLPRMMGWRSRWHQRTLRALGAGCGEGYRPGRPSRWEDRVGLFFEVMHAADWQKCAALFTNSEEERFLRWLQEGSPM